MSLIILLHQVQLAENIGAVARAMGNFALQELRLISPEMSPLDEKAIAMSAGATDILENAVVFDSLEEATADIHWLYGTCATTRQLIKTYTPIHQATPRILSQQREGKVGILFGPERTGLDKACLARCHEIIQIPTNPDFSSLNIAQACVVIGYEIYKTAGEMVEAPEFKDTLYYGETRPAPQEQMTSFLYHVENLLDEANYWRVPSKKKLMWQNLQNLFTRFHPTEQDLQTLRGVIQILQRPRK